MGLVFTTVILKWVEKDLINTSPRGIAIINSYNSGRRSYVLLNVLPKLELFFHNITQN